MKNIKFALLAIFVNLFLIASAQAATYTVDRTDDATVSTCNAATANDCTLRGAIAAANAAATADIINFDTTVFNTAQTITLGGTELSIANNGTLTIDGLGANMLTISGNNMSRVFNISASANVSIYGLTVTGANVTNANGGGIVVNASSTLALTRVVVTDNYGQSGGGILLLANSTVNLFNTTISNNNSAVSSGSIGGGILNQGGTLNVDASTFSGNQDTAAASITAAVR